MEEKIKRQKKWRGGGDITCVTKTGTLQQKFKTAFFTYAYKYDESRVQTPSVETTFVSPCHSISSSTIHHICVTFSMCRTSLQKKIVVGA